LCSIKYPYIEDKIYSNKYSSNAGIDWIIEDKIYLNKYSSNAGIDWNRESFH